MADIGGVVLSFAIDKLLEEVLTAIRHVRNSSKNLRQLQNLLECLQPSVQELNTKVRDENHPAGKWLLELREQLVKARDLLNASSSVRRNIFKIVDISKKSLELYASIQALLLQASVPLLASGVSEGEFQAQIRAKLTEMTAYQEKIERLLRGIATLDGPVHPTRAMSDLLAEVSDAGIADRSGSSSAADAQTLSEDVPKPEVNFGGESVANDLVHHLVNGNYKKWVGLWGMGGIGKTFTASQVYHDSQVRQHFSGGIFWLTVSKDQPGPKHLFEKLLGKLIKPPNPQLPYNLDEAKALLKRMLDRDRVLLVLDDVWQEDVLEHLDVISESKKGVILVTTRDKGVLRRVIHFVDIFEIQPLSEEDSWQLFSWHAFRVRRVAPSDLEDVAKEVAWECRGLPLALEVIGSTMANRELLPEESALGLTSFRVWEVALKHLRRANHAEDDYAVLYKKLQLSVDSLEEHDVRLRDCFFYFAAFAEDEEVEVEVLVDMWIAEGLVQEDGKSSLSFTPEEQVKTLLGILAAKSMIKLTSRSGHLRCKVHDVMRDVAQRNLKWNVGEGREIEATARDCLYAPGLEESELPADWTASQTACSAKRLSLRLNKLRKFPGDEQFIAPRLKVLILSENGLLQSLSPGFFNHLLDLRVLDLRWTRIQNMPSKILRSLKSLVLLDLRFCSELREVLIEPNSLLNLEFLFLDNCHGLLHLPKVDHMPKLKVYSARVPTVPNLSATDSTGFFEYMPTCGGGGSRQRHKWRSSKVLSSYQLPAGLKRLSLVKNSTGHPSEQDQYSFDVSSLCALESLSVYGCRLSFNVERLHRLEVLHVVSCDEVQVSALGKLPVLEKLRVTLRSRSRTNCAHAGSFLSLRKLDIHWYSNSKEKLVFYPGTMPQIASLGMTWEAQDDWQLPTSVTNLHSLKRLTLRFESAAKSVVTDEDVQFLYRKPADFPHLEYLEISGTITKTSGHSRSFFPKHFLERQKQGTLTLVDNRSFLDPRVHA